MILAGQKRKKHFTNIRHIIEHPDILGVIFDEYLTQWFRKAIEERANEETKYDDENI